MNEVATVGLDEFFWNGRDLVLLAARVSVNWTGVLAEAGPGGGDDRAAALPRGTLGHGAQKTGQLHRVAAE